MNTELLKYYRENKTYVCGHCRHKISSIFHLFKCRDITFKEFLQLKTNRIDLRSYFSRLREKGCDLFSPIFNFIWILGFSFATFIINLIIAPAFLLFYYFTNDLIMQVATFVVAFGFQIVLFLLLFIKKLFKIKFHRG
jgi:hypothetical protein